MQIMTTDNGNGNTINIRTDERLDFSACGMFSQAWKLTEYPEIENIEIDLGDTRYINDSGLAMLLLLSERTRKLVGQIKLVNCNAELINRLSCNPLATAFHVA
jgi:anti-anti-sigma regulatory factor